MPKREINVGLFIAHSPEAQPETLQPFVQQLARDITEELDASTDMSWCFHLADPARLPSDDPVQPADLLDEATLRMVEGPMDLVIAITDVGLLSRERHIVAGLAAPIARVAVLSTRKLLITRRNQPTRSLDDATVRWNGTALLLHLLGHILGLPHSREHADPMAPFRFDEHRDHMPHFTEQTRARLRRQARHAPEREYEGPFLGALGFHLNSAAANPRQIMMTVMRSRAPLIPLALPKLATAAVAPTIILVFTAEIWDAGLHMTDAVVYALTLTSIIAATWYLMVIQHLSFPRKETRILTEHMAVVNVAVLITMLLASLGLFFLVWLLMMGIVLFVFPPDLIATWPTLEDPQVTLMDKVRLAAFISTIGVITGALAGGLEDRAVIRHLALFMDET